MVGLQVDHCRPQDGVRRAIVEPLAELKRLSDNMFAIVDSERVSANVPAVERRLSFQRNCEALGIGCLILERRAVENYLDLDVARSVMQVPGAPDFVRGVRGMSRSSILPPRNRRALRKASADLGVEQGA
jgi:hypothetical protein